MTDPGTGILPFASQIVSSLAWPAGSFEISESVHSRAYCHSAFFLLFLFFGTSFFFGLPPGSGTYASTLWRFTNVFCPKTMVLSLPRRIRLAMACRVTPRMRAASEAVTQSSGFASKFDKLVAFDNRFCYHPCSWSFGFIHYPRRTLMCAHVGSCLSLRLGPG
jgi:hypothetical protein